MKPSDIISDAEIERVHANANFGSAGKREVVAIGVLDYAFGYTTGSTLLSILVEHGLVRRPRPGSSATGLTYKGKKYLKATFGEHLQDFVRMVKP
jgi:hypothetical protein